MIRWSRELAHGWVPVAARSLPRSWAAADSRTRRSRRGGGPAQPPPPRVALAVERRGEALGSPGSDLDLGGDELSHGRFGEYLVLLTGGMKLLEPMLQLERFGVDQRELLLDRDGEVRRSLEPLPGFVHVQEFQ